MHDPELPQKAYYDFDDNADVKLFSIGSRSFRYFQINVKESTGGRPEMKTYNILQESHGFLARLTCRPWKTLKVEEVPAYRNNWESSLDKVVDGMIEEGDEVFVMTT